MIKPRYLIGFTGHRAGFDPAKIGSTLRSLLGEFLKRASADRIQVELCTSAAEGADILCLEIARELGMATHLLLPLPEEEFKKDFSSPETWLLTKGQLERAKQRPGPDSLRLIDGGTTRPGCYFNQGVEMLGAVDVLIAVWNGKPAKGLGGTEQIVNQAIRMGIPVAIVDPATGKTGGGSHEDIHFQPDETMAEINGMLDDREVASVEELQRRLDTVAVKEAEGVRASLVRVIVLHGIAALLAVAGTFELTSAASNEHWWDKTRWLITGTQLLLVGLALWMSIRLQKKHAQERWIRCRFACELVRSLRCSIPILDPLHPVVARLQPQWRRFALSVGLAVQEEQLPEDLTTLRDKYVQIRLSETHPEGQIRHYKAMQSAALQQWNTTGYINRWSTMLAPFFVLLSLLNKLGNRLPNDRAWHLDENPMVWALVVFLPIALPLLAGMTGGLQHVLDAGRRRDRYPQVVDQLNRIKAALPGLQTLSSIRDAVSCTEDLLLNEHLEWQFAMKNTGHQAPRS